MKALISVLEPYMAHIKATVVYNDVRAYMSKHAVLGTHTPHYLCSLRQSIICVSCLPIARDKRV